MLFIQDAYAQAAPQAGGGASSIIMMVLLIIGVGILYGLWASSYERSLLVTLGAIALAVGVFLLPAYGIYRYWVRRPTSRCSTA